MNEANNTEDAYESPVVSLMVTDIMESIEFYTEKLGLELTDTEESEDIDSAEVSAPGIHIMLQRAAQGTTVISDEDMPIGFQVSSFEEAMTMLEENEITYTIEKDDNVHLAYFTDPDGHVLYLFKVVDKN